jgi:FkbM family methyltransferase
VRAAIQFFAKKLPVYPTIEYCRDWCTLRRGLMRGTFSQYAEDRFVLDYFNGRPGFYIDVGANHPFRISNTYLLYLNGWSGITVEPMPQLGRKHRRYRPRDQYVNAGAGAEDGTMTLYNLVPSVLTTFDERIAEHHVRSGRALIASTPTIPVRTIASLCEDLHVDKTISFLNIDCEGFDLNVLRGVNWHSQKPTLVCVETAGVIANLEEHHTTETDICTFLIGIGYKALAKRGANTIFEHE